MPISFGIIPSYKLGPVPLPSVISTGAECTKQITITATKMTAELLIMTYNN